MLHLNGGFNSTIEYDDGVHYGSALLLLHGQVPYKDFVFLQPPGITVLLTPLAALGLVTKASVGFVAARVATALSAGVTTALLGRLVARHCGLARGVAAALVYLSATASLIAGSTVMIEPWLSLAIVLCLTFLADPLSAKHPLAAGAFAGLASTLKVWGVVFAIITVCWLCWHETSRVVRRFVTGAVAVVLVVYGPFFALAPRTMFRDVISTQAERPAAGIQGFANRWQDLLAVGPIGGGLKVVILVAAAGLLLLIGSSCWRAGIFGKLVVLQAIGGFVLFVLAAPFYSHYGEYLVPFLAIGIALAWPAAGATTSSGFGVGNSGFRRKAAAGMLGGVLVIAGGSWQVSRAIARTHSASVRVSSLRHLVGRHTCVVSDQMTTMVLANAPLRCAWLDPRGEALTSLVGTAPDHFYPFGFRAIAQWQSQWRRRLMVAQIAILTDSPCRHQEWGQSLCAYVEHHYRLLGVVGSAGPSERPVEVWARTATTASQPMPVTRASSPRAWPKQFLQGG